MLNCPSCVFADFDSGKCKRLLIRLPHICPYSEERKPRNRFEQFKAMSVEELAAYIDKHTAEAMWCNSPPWDCPPNRECVECILNWLLVEVE